MIYATCSVATGTHMDANGLPGWVDMLGGVGDVAITVGVVYALTLL